MVNRILVKLLPDLIEMDEPVKQLGVLHFRHIAGKCLIEVMVRVHETGSDDTAPSVNNVITFLHGKIRSDFLNGVTVDPDIHSPLIRFIIGC